MSYINKQRPRQGLSGLWDDIKGITTGAIDFYGQSQRDAGAAAATSQQGPAAIMPSGGIDTGTMLMIGALGIGAIVLLKKKK